MNEELILEVPSDISSIHRAVEYVVRRCSTCVCHPHRLRLNLRVGLTEALTNAIMYGNDRDPSKRVRVEITVRGGRLEARITDEGPGFDPAGIPDPTHPENLHKDHGRGLFLMRQLLDEVSYNDQGNQVRLVLHLDGDAPLEGGARA